MEASWFTSVGYRAPLSGLSFGALLADRGFDSDSFAALLASLGSEAVVPPKANRKKAMDRDMGEVREAAPRGELLLSGQGVQPHCHTSG